MSLSFKTAAEKQKAYDQVETDPPPGVDVEEFIRETNAKLDEISAAPVETGEDNPFRNPEDDLNDPINPENQPKKENPVEKSTQPTQTEPQTVKPQNPPSNPPPGESNQQPKPDDEIDRLRRKNDYLETSRISMERDFSEKLSALTEQIEQLKAQPVQKKEPKEQKTEVDHEIIAVRDEIASLEKEMNESSEDYDPSKAIEFQVRSNKLNLRLNTLTEKKHSELTERQQAEITDLKNKQRLERENAQAKIQEEAKNQAIEGFRQNIPDLVGDKTYAQLDAEYGDFSREVASILYGVRPDQVKASDRELAMQKYLEGSPILNESLERRGIKEPEELHKFIALSEIEALRQGFTLDKITGKFVELRDAAGQKVNFPDHHAAYLYLQQQNGSHTQKMLETQQSTAQNVMHAITRKADPVELTQQDQNQAPSREMGREDAMAILEKVDIDTITKRARENFNDPLVTQYNAALRACDYAEIDPRDLE